MKADPVRLLALDLLVQVDRGALLDLILFCGQFTWQPFCSLEDLFLRLYSDSGEGTR